MSTVLFSTVLFLSQIAPFAKQFIGIIGLMCDGSANGHCGG